MIHHGAPWAMGLEAGGVNSVATPTGYYWVNGYSNGVLAILRLFPSSQSVPQVARTSMEPQLSKLSDFESSAETNGNHGPISAARSENTDS